MYSATGKYKEDSILEGVAVLTNTVSDWGISTQYAIKQWAENHQLDVINLQFQTAAFDMSPWIHFLPQISLNKALDVYDEFVYPEKYMKK